MFSSNMQAIENVHVNHDEVGDVEMDSMNPGQSLDSKPEKRRPLAYTAMS